MTTYSHALLSRLPVLATGAVAAALVLSACGGSSGGTTSAAGAAGGSSSGAVAQVKTLSGTGPTLVSAQGRPLYLEQGETVAMFACTGDCLKTWPPLLVRAGAKPAITGVDAAKVSTAKRPDGTVQVVFDGHPLYSFRLDNGAATASGNGATDQFGGAKLHWLAATTSGRPAPSGSSSSSKRGGGYGY